MSEVMDRAIDILREGGWTRGATEDNGQHCLLGALWEAEKQLSYGGAHYINVHMVWRVLQTHHHASNIPMWNDYVARDADEVIGVLKLAGELLDEREAAHERAGR